MGNIRIRIRLNYRREYLSLVLTLAKLVKNKKLGLLVIESNAENTIMCNENMLKKSIHEEILREKSENSLGIYPTSKQIFTQSSKKVLSSPSLHKLKSSKSWSSDKRTPLLQKKTSNLNKTVMLLSLPLSYIISTFPTFVLIAISYIRDFRRDKIELENRFDKEYAVSKAAMYSYNSFNIAFFILFGKSFRKDLKNLLKCKYYRK